MTVWTDDRIPIAVAPLPGEALESWIGAYARRLRITNSEFLSFAGLPASRTRPMALRLLPSEAAALGRSTGIPLPALISMTLEPYDGFAVSFMPGQRRLGRAVAWRFSGSRNRFCPSCLAEQNGRGPVFWRLPWAFACLQHQCLLLDFCPACHRFPNHWKARRLGPSGPSSCTLNSSRSITGTKQPCGYRLTEASALQLPGDGPVLAAQRHISSLLGSERAGRPAALAEFKRLYALAWRILRGLHTILGLAPEVVHATLAECGGGLPEVQAREVGHDAHNVAVGTTLALIALQSGHTEHEPLFDWILQADRSLLQKQKFSIGRMAARWEWSGPELVQRALGRLDREATLHARLRYASATPQPRWPTLNTEAIHRRAAMIPAMLWPSWTMRLLPLARGGNRYRTTAFRRGCSSFLLLPGGPPTLNFERAGPLLGNYYIDRDRDSIERRTYGGQDLAPLASTLAQLAYALDEHGSPIDYNRRRELFTNTSVTLDLDAYRRFCTQQGSWTGTEHRIHILRWYLLMLLTGEFHPTPSGAASHFTRNCTEFRFRATAALRGFLHEQARFNLTHHRIDEPVTWDPPAEWVTEASWPGADPHLVDPEAVRDALKEAKSADGAATHLPMGTEHLRLYCDITNTPATRGPVIGLHNPQSVDRRDVLAPARLRNLYVTQKKSLEHIATLAGCGPRTVHQLIIQNGIRPRGRRSHPLCPDITRDWLHNEYIVNRNNPTALARQRGITIDHIIFLARSWDIPIRPGGAHHNDIADLDLPHPPSPTMQKVTMSRYALDRLRLMMNIPGHVSLAAAARAFYDGRGGALRQRVSEVENAVGFLIIDRSTKPLAPTKRGREFLGEAAEILRIADTARLHQE
ncbi:TniQ family protein [Streptomyces sp. NPDC005485]|uniref:TniQ family protein n=1 Tax=Streptomyces sp. NPDC005485 TaxID=3155591 RepID=UPI0033AB2C44